MGLLARGAGLRLFRFFRRDITRQTASTAADNSLIVRCLDENEVFGLSTDRDLDLRPEMIRHALEQGGLCVGAFRREDLAGYCWLAFSPVPHLDGVWVDFHRHAAWTYKSFVRPQYRGQGIAKALYVVADAACIERDRRFSIICVESHNRPSVSAARKASYADCGYAAYVKGRTFAAWLSPGARQAGLRFYIPGSTRS